MVVVAAASRALPGPPWTAARRGWSRWPRPIG